MIANIVTFISPYVLLYKSFRLSPDYAGLNLDIFELILILMLYIIPFIFIITLINTLKLFAKSMKLKKQNEEEEYIVSRKKLLLYKISTILLGITAVNCALGFDRLARYGPFHGYHITMLFSSPYKYHYNNKYPYS